METRRKFTKEFKEEAVRRLGLGASVGGRGIPQYAPNLIISKAISDTGH